MRKYLTLSFISLSLCCAFLVAGCASKPTDEEMNQLSNLKSEVSSLEKQISEKQRTKSDLEKQIADQNSKLQQCQSDQEAVKKGLGK